ncbi:MAG TPA: sulfide/dihydroorotate dehydrogenase-like FAD/NAD-binding protein [Candidatus Bathyarchaeia archaeon]|nr:sulfide/dihydroorotate dehydrogenase-like FAD/NAD-binding protein [Candidatus Bathyarchaeia archaeon]
MFEVCAPEIAAKAEPGQFVIVTIQEKGERIPLTIAGLDRETGTITIVFNEVGKTTKQLGTFKEGDSIPNIAGPLGNPSEIQKFGRVLCVGGGVMAAPLYYVAKTLHEAGNEIVAVVGARMKDLLVFEEEMKGVAKEFYVTTDDGSKGYKGLDFLKEILNEEKFDRVVVMGPVVMMKTVSEMTKPFNIKTVVTLTPIMVDGMGMCGACRVTVKGETKFGCVDGPEFDGHMIDFDELIKRQRVYSSEERLASVFYEKLGGCKCDNA